MMRYSGHNRTPTVSLYGFPDTQTQRSWSDLKEFRFHPRFYDCPCDLQERIRYNQK